MKVNCTCMDFQYNVVSIIDTCILYCINKFGSEDFDIKIFKYCAYCGTKLVEVKDVDSDIP